VQQLVQDHPVLLVGRQAVEGGCQELDHVGGRKAEGLLEDGRKAPDAGPRVRPGAGRPHADDPVRLHVPEPQDLGHLHEPRVEVGGGFPPDGHMEFLRWTVRWTPAGQLHRPW